MAATNGSETMTEFSTTDSLASFVSPPAILSMELLPCDAGTEFSEGVGCAECSLGLYTFGNPLMDQKCYECPTSDAVSCLGGKEVLVSSGYWTFSSSFYATTNNTNLMLLTLYECPYQFCQREEAVAIDESYCNPESHRDSNSPLCGKCLVQSVCYNCCFNILNYSFSFSFFCVGRLFGVEFGLHSLPRGVWHDYFYKFAQDIGSDTPHSLDFSSVRVYCGNAFIRGSVFHAHVLSRH